MIKNICTTIGALVVGTIFVIGLDELSKAESVEEVMDEHINNFFNLRDKESK